VDKRSWWSNHDLLISGQLPVIHGWLVGWSVGQLFIRSFGCSFIQSASQSVGWLFGWSLVGWLVGWMVISSSVGWLVGWLVGQLVGRLVGWLLVGRLVGWASSSSWQHQSPHYTHIYIRASDEDQVFHLVNVHMMFLYNKDTWWENNQSTPWLSVSTLNQWQSHKNRFRQSGIHTSHNLGNHLKSSQYREQELALAQPLTLCQPLPVTS